MPEATGAFCNPEAPLHLPHLGRELVYPRVGRLGTITKWKDGPSETTSSTVLLVAHDLSGLADLPQAPLCSLP